MLKALLLAALCACSPACAHTDATGPRRHADGPDLDLSALLGLEEPSMYKVGEKPDEKGAVSIEIEGKIKSDAAAALKKALDKAAAVKGAKSILIKLNSEGGDFDE